MGKIGSFITGAAAGIIGLGLVSWAYVSFLEENQSEAEKEEE